MDDADPTCARERDAELSAAAAAAGELHYAIRFNAFMGVRSDFTLKQVVKLLRRPEIISYFQAGFGEGLSFEVVHCDREEGAPLTRKEAHDQELEGRRQAIHRSVKEDEDIQRVCDDMGARIVDVVLPEELC